MHAKRSAALFFPGTCIFLCRYEFERRTGKLKEIGSSVRDEKTADQKNVLMIHCKTAKNCQQSYMFRTVCFKIKTCSKFKSFKFQRFHVWSTHSCCASMQILADLLSWMMRNMLPVSMQSLSAAHKKEMCQSNTPIPCKNMFTPHVVSKPHLTWCVAFGTPYSPRRFGPETLFCGNHPQPFATVSRLVQNSMRIAKTLQKKKNWQLPSLPWVKNIVQLVQGGCSPNSVSTLTGSYGKSNPSARSGWSTWVPAF